jgi:hypothetical protein
MRVSSPGPVIFWPIERTPAIIKLDIVRYYRRWEPSRNSSVWRADSLGGPRFISKWQRCWPAATAAGGLGRRGAAANSLHGSPPPASSIASIDVSAGTAPAWIAVAIFIGAERSSAQALGDHSCVAIAIARPAPAREQKQSRRAHASHTRIWAEAQARGDGRTARSGRALCRLCDRAVHARAGDSIHRKALVRSRRSSRLLLGESDSAPRLAQSLVGTLALSHLHSSGPAACGRVPSSQSARPLGALVTIPLGAMAARRGGQ